MPDLEQHGEYDEFVALPVAENVAAWLGFELGARRLKLQTPAYYVLGSLCKAIAIADESDLAPVLERELLRLVKNDDLKLFGSRHYLVRSLLATIPAE